MIATAVTGLTLTARGGLGLAIFTAHILVLVLVFVLVIVFAPRHAAATAFAAKAHRVESAVILEVYEK